MSKYFTRNYFKNYGNFTFYEVYLYTCDSHGKLIGKDIVATECCDYDSLESTENDLISLADSTLFSYSLSETSKKSVEVLAFTIPNPDVLHLLIGEFLYGEAYDPDRDPYFNDLYEDDDEEEEDEMYIFDEEIDESDMEEFRDFILKNGYKSKFDEIEVYSNSVDKYTPCYHNTNATTVFFFDVQEGTVGYRENLLINPSDKQIEDLITSARYSASCFSFEEKHSDEYYTQVYGIELPPELDTNDQDDLDDFIFESIQDYKHILLDIRFDYNGI